MKKKSHERLYSNSNDPKLSGIDSDSEENYLEPNYKDWVIMDYWSWFQAGCLLKEVDPNLVDKNGIWNFPKEYKHVETFARTMITWNPGNHHPFWWINKALKEEIEIPQKLFIEIKRKFLNYCITDENKERYTSSFPCLANYIGINLAPKKESPRHTSNIDFEYWAEKDKWKKYEVAVLICKLDPQNIQCLHHGKGIMYHILDEKIEISIDFDSDGKAIRYIRVPEEYRNEIKNKFETIDTWLDSPENHPYSYINRALNSPSGTLSVPDELWKAIEKRFVYECENYPNLTEEYKIIAKKAGIFPENNKPSEQPNKQKIENNLLKIIGLLATYCAKRKKNASANAEVSVSALVKELSPLITSENDRFPPGLSERQLREKIGAGLALIEPLLQKQSV